MAIKKKAMDLMLRMCGFGSCKELDEHCYDYSEGHLVKRKENKIQRHLRICKECVRFMASYLAVRTMGKMIHPEKLTPEQQEKLLAGLNLK